MSVGDIIRVSLVGKIHSQLTVNTFHYEQITGAVGDFSDFLATEWAGHCMAAITAATSAEWQATHIISQRIQPLPIMAAFTTVLTGMTGAIVGAAVPSSVSVVIKKLTELAGHANRGRTYFAGCPAAHTLSSQLLAPGPANWDAVAQVLDDVLPIVGPDQFEPVVYHRGFGTAQKVVKCVHTNILRNQRRRQVGRGE